MFPGLWDRDEEVGQSWRSVEWRGIQSLEYWEWEAWWVTCYLVSRRNIWHATWSQEILGWPCPLAYLPLHLSMLAFPPGTPVSCPALNHLSFLSILITEPETPISSFKQASALALLLRCLADVGLFDCWQNLPGHSSGLPSIWHTVDIIGEGGGPWHINFKRRSEVKNRSFPNTQC